MSETEIIIWDFSDYKNAKCCFKHVLDEKYGEKKVMLKGAV